jgi:hypothetical protein
MIALFMGSLVVAYGMFLFGKSIGRRDERSRCHDLCHRAILKRWSGTTRWVMNAISSGGTLMPAEEFFGPKTLHEDSDADGKWYVCESLLTSGRRVIVRMPYDQTAEEAGEVAENLREISEVVQRWEQQ